MYLPPLFQGTLLKRYKRFLADVVLEDGRMITAHVPNSGAMTSTIAQGCPVWVSYHENPKRKLAYTLELTEMEGGLVCVNTQWANTLVVEGIQNGVIEELQGYDHLKPEQRYGQNSRIDVLLWQGEQKCYVEVKSVTLRLGETLAFPDAVSARGTKHLHELMAMKRAGHRAVMVYVIGRSEALPFRIAHEIDPLYAKAFKEAQEAGVEVLVYQMGLTCKALSLEKRKMR